MKTFRFLVLIILGFSLPNVWALPPIQHRVDSTVRSVDREKLVLTLTPVVKDGPTAFIIQPGRTRLRRDGKPATIEQLSSGDVVRVYFKREMGAEVATEVSWKSTSPASR